MIGDENLKWPNLSEESHLFQSLNQWSSIRQKYFIDTVDPGIKYFIFEGLQNYCCISNVKRNISITVMNHPITDFIHRNDGNDVAMATWTSALHLTKELYFKEVIEMRTEEFRLKSKGLLKFFLHSNEVRWSGFSSARIVLKRTSSKGPSLVNPSNLHLHTEWNQIWHIGDISDLLYQAL